MLCPADGVIRLHGNTGNIHGSGAGQWRGKKIRKFMKEEGEKGIQDAAAVPLNTLRDIQCKKNTKTDG